MALKLKSNNTQGNPYHDEEGKFTSKEGEGNKRSSDPLMDLFGSLGKTMRDSEAEEKEAMKIFGLNETEKKQPSLAVGEDSRKDSSSSKSVDNLPNEEDKYDYPDTVIRFHDDESETDMELDVDTEDIIEFFGDELSEEQKQLYKKYAILPKSVIEKFDLNNLSENYDFIDFMKEKYADEYNEQAQTYDPLADPNVIAPR